MGLGIDVSLVWLVVARRMIEEHGGQATLCAAFAESLPLPDASVPAVVSLDVIEHVADQPRYLAEIDRIAADGAAIAFATPNRYSLAAEPHVHVWGVGWLPVRFQKRYVRARSGQPYEYVRLLSVPGLARLLRRHTDIEGRFVVPRVPDDEIASYDPRRATLAHAYNRMAEWPLAALATPRGRPVLSLHGHEAYADRRRARPSFATACAGDVDVTIVSRHARETLSRRDTNLIAHSTRQPT